jgi:hypothetical protein
MRLYKEAKEYIYIPQFFNNLESVYSNRRGQVSNLAAAPCRAFLLAEALQKL